MERYGYLDVPTSEFWTQEFSFSFRIVVRFYLQITIFWDKTPWSHVDLNRHSNKTSVNMYQTTRR
jgi:hypothetical protein